MAQFFPTRTSCLGRMWPGERRLSERIDAKLEDDYLIWYDVPVGPKQLHPDFIILHPARGVLVLEVKDWRPDTIRSGNLQSVSILTDRGEVTERNPLLQARAYVLEVVVTLERDAALRNPPGHRYQGKLIMPYGWGAVLTNITRKQFEEYGFDQFLQPDKVICQDEMLESVDPMAFQQRLWDMFTQVFPCAITLPQIDRVRHHLFPEMRVTIQPNQFGLFEDPNAIKIPDLIRVMDLQQESLARSLGDGHRVIHGVAGSGKTMILGYRCLRLARALNKPILVLCYNVTLAARLRDMLEVHGIADRVNVLHFHDWCKQMLIAYQVDVPKYNPDGEIYAAELVAKTVVGVDQGRIPRGQYGAVLIDEGHDFAPDWLKLVVQMVDPDTNSVLVLYDDAQSIYERGPRRNFSFASVGIQARGRTTVLKLNYRNTAEILAAARAFAQELLAAADTDEDGAPVILPESAGRRGTIPELIERVSVEEEAKLIVSRIEDEVAQGRLLSDIAVVYRTAGKVVKAIENRLKERQIPYRSITGPEGKRGLFQGEPSVKLLTMHSAKGLEFASVYMPGLGELPSRHDSEDQAVRLFYVGMTRARDSLVMTHSTHSAYVEKMSKALSNVRLLV